jgi:hypothetical protein
VSCSERDSNGNQNVIPPYCKIYGIKELSIQSVALIENAKYTDTELYYDLKNGENIFFTIPILYHISDKISSAINKRTSSALGVERGSSGYKS